MPCANDWRSVNELGQGDEAGSLRSRAGRGRCRRV